MVLGRVPAHDQHHVGVLDVDPTVGHCAASECGPQTGDRGAMSDAGLVFQIADPQAAHRLDYEIVEFVCIGAASTPGNPFTSISRPTLAILFNKRVVPSLFYQPGDFGYRIIPRDIIPVVRSGPPYLRLEQAAVVQDILVKRRSLWTQCAAVDRMIRIAFHVYHLRSGVFSFVAKCMNYHATAN